MRLGMRMQMRMRVSNVWQAMNVSHILLTQAGRTRAGPGLDQAGPSQIGPKYIIFSQNIDQTIVYNPGQVPGSNYSVKVSFISKILSNIQKTLKTDFSKFFYIDPRGPRGPLGPHGPPNQLGGPGDPWDQYNFFLKNRFFKVFWKLDSILLINDTLTL